jgi:hypothetical protein
MARLLERRGIQFSGRVMEKVYFGIGAVLYLLFVAWCMVTPHK